METDKTKKACIFLMKVHGDDVIAPTPLKSQLYDELGIEDDLDRIIIEDCVESLNKISIERITLLKAIIMHMASTVDVLDIIEWANALGSRILEFLRDNPEYKVPKDGRDFLKELTDLI